MKNLILISLLLPFIFSCKQNKYSEKSYSGRGISFDIGYNDDTTIGQDIWSLEGKYVLQTWVRTSSNQHIPTKYRFDAYISGSPMVPYVSEIIGKFDYIKDAKIIEYKKADSFFKEISGLTILQRKINDSVELLKRIPTTNDTIEITVINPYGLIVPEIKWPVQSPITYPQTLDLRQLCATSNVKGKFIYEPYYGNQPNAGMLKLSATFIPDDPHKYATVKASVNLLVNKGHY